MQNDQLPPPGKDPDSESSDLTEVPRIGPEPPEEPAGRPAAFLSWPPPGLEVIQGALLPASVFLLLGAGILVLPLLYSIASEQPFTRISSLGAMWWMLPVAIGFGLLLLLEGFHRLFRILRIGNNRVRQGHGWLTILHVANDGTRDTGFLLQGARAFAGIDPAQKQALLTWRLLGTGGYLASALWLLIGFVFCILLAARGAFGPLTLWCLTLIPSALLLILAVFSRLRAGLLIRAINRSATVSEAAEMESQIAHWIDQADSFSGEGILGRGSVAEARSLRIGTVVALVIGLILLVPMLTFTFMGTAVPASTAMAIPRFSGVQQKALLWEPVRPYRLSADPAISAEEAGQALQNLNYVATDGKPRELERAPAIVHSQGWQFGRRRQSGTPKAITLLEKPTSELTDREWEVMRSEAANPAHGEYGILGRAAAADFGGALWSLPFPDSLSWSDFPIPRFQGITDGARSHVAVAAYELHSGRPARAEERIREVIGTGFLMRDEHPTLIGNLIGIVIIGIGADALDSFYRFVGRDEEATELAHARKEMEDLVRGGFGRDPMPDVQGAVDWMSRIVWNKEYMRGLRWELMPTVTTTAGLGNLHLAVFGPGESYDYWLENVHASLVRYPAEEELFEMMKYGWFGSPEAMEQGGFVEWLLSLTFGKSNTPGSFAAMLRSAR